LRLSEWTPEIPDQRLAEELRGTISRLRERNTPHRQLLEKLARGDPLSKEELTALRHIGAKGPSPSTDN
jgi:uncharacterized coiled-coil DUF342 family protein